MSVVEKVGQSHTWALTVAILVGAAAISGSILFIGRWEISGGDNSTTIIRLDRWTGKIDACMVDATQTGAGEPWTYKCPFVPGATSDNSN
ncbi:MAG TPA: hypothetical protein VHY79_10200 [Rhizomicrobium sp.]|jgi:hypothetical protein|nr:hypothetical protein [Rhizomicrobium sp.]